VATVKARIHAGQVVSNGLFALLGGVDLTVAAVSNARSPTLSPWLVGVRPTTTSGQRPAGNAAVALLTGNVIDNAVATALVRRTIGAASIPGLEIAIIAGLGGTEQSVAAHVDEANAEITHPHSCSHIAPLSIAGLIAGGELAGGDASAVGVIAEKTPRTELLTSAQRRIGRRTIEPGRANDNGAHQHPRSSLSHLEIF
jgi:hypothetical protein